MVRGPGSGDRTLLTLIGAVAFSASGQVRYDDGRRLASFDDAFGADLRIKFVNLAQGTAQDLIQ